MIPHLSHSACARRRRASNPDLAPSSDLVVASSDLVQRPEIQSERHLPRRVRRVLSRNCQNIQRLGFDHTSFRRTRRGCVANEERMTDALRIIQQQVAALERRRALLESLHFARFANARQLAAHKVHEYYGHFRHGFDPRVPDRSSALEAILRSILLETVQSPAFETIDQFLRQWANYSKYHAKVSVTIMGIEPLDEDVESDAVYGDTVVVKCTGRTTFRISRDTIAHFFQPVMHDEALVQKLIGQEYCFPFATLFHFAMDSGRVFRLEPRADLAAGLLNLVSDPFVTVKLLSASQLTSDGLLNAYPEPSKSSDRFVEIASEAA